MGVPVSQEEGVETACNEALTQGFELVPKVSWPWVPLTQWVWGGPRCQWSALFARAADLENWTREGAVGSAWQNSGNPRMFQDG